MPPARSSRTQPRRGIRGGDGSHSGSGGRSSGASSAHARESTFWSASIENTVFGVFYLLIDGKKRAKSRLFPLLLLLFDVYSLATLLVRSDLGWPIDSIAIKLNVVEVAIAKVGDQNTLFVSLFAAAVCTVWLSIIDAGVVAWSFQTNNFLEVPAQILRLVVQVVITAAYISLLQILLIPLRCASLATRLTNDVMNTSVCSTPSGIAFTSVSAVTLAAFLPLAAAAALFSQNEDFHSVLLSGRNALADTLIRTVLVVVAVWQPDMHGALVSIIFFGVMTYMCGRIVRTLPFEELWVNQLRASVYAVVAWLAVTTFILSVMSPGGAQARKLDALRTVAIVMVCLSPIALVVASGAVSLRSRILRRAAGIAADASLQVEAAAAGASSPVAVPATPLPGRRGTPPPAALSPAAGVHFAETPSDAIAVAVASPKPGAAGALVPAISATSPVARSTSRSAALFQSMNLRVEDGLVYAGQDVNLEAAAAAHVFDHWPGNVRLVALAALHTNMDASVSNAEHVQRLRRQLYTKDAVAMAEAVYNLGLVAFSDAVAVRIAYAQFLAMYRKDDTRAMGMLQTVSKFTPSIEQRFVVFSYSRTLEQQRQSDDLGTRVNMIGVLAFRQTYRQALGAHQLALRNLLQFWKLVAKMQEITGLGKSNLAAITAAGETDAGKEAVNAITTKVAALLASRAEASSAYDRLLLKYPGAVILLRTYANFLRDVSNDSAGADTLMARASQAEAEAAPADADDARKTVGAASAKLSVGHHSEHSGGGSSGQKAGSRGYGSANKTLHVRNDGVQAVQSMKTYMGMSLVMLGLLVIASFITVRQLQGEALHQVSLVDSVANMAKLAFSSAYWVRSLTMAANDADVTRFAAARAWVAKYSAQYKDRLRYLYNPSNLYPESQIMLDTPTLSLRELVLGPPPVLMTSLTGLYDMTNDIISSSMLLAQYPMNLLTTAAANVNAEYQLVMLNAPVAFRAWLDASLTYARHVLATSAQFRVILIVLLIVVFLVVCFMWFAVFMPSVVRVAAAHAGIEAVVRAIPMSAVRSLVNKYAKKLNQLDALADEVEAAADGGGGSDHDDSDLEGPEHSDTEAFNGDNNNDEGNTSDGEEREGDGPAVGLVRRASAAARRSPVALRSAHSMSTMDSHAATTSMASPRGPESGGVTMITPRVQVIGDADDVFKSLSSPRESEREVQSASSPSKVRVSAASNVDDTSPAPDAPAPEGNCAPPVPAPDAPDELDDLLFQAKPAEEQVQAVAPVVARHDAPSPAEPIAAANNTARVTTASDLPVAHIVGLPGSVTLTPIPADALSAPIPPSTARARPRRLSGLVQSTPTGPAPARDSVPARARRRQSTDVQAARPALADASPAPGSRLMTENSFHARHASDSLDTGTSKNEVRLVPSMSRFSFFISPVSRFLARTRRMTSRGGMSAESDDTEKKGVRRHFSPLLRTLMLRVGVALFVALGLQCANFAVNQQDVDFAAAKAQSIQVAGTRRAYSGMISMYARELLIGDGALLDNVTLTRGLRLAVDNFVYYHQLLQLGDGGTISRTAGAYQPQDELVFGSVTAAAFQLQNPNTTAVDTMVALTSSFGLAAQINFYSNAGNNVLQRFEPWYGSTVTATRPFNATVARVVGPTNIGLLPDDDIQFIIRVDRAGGPLSVQLETSTELFFAEMNASADQTQTVQVVVFVGNLMLLVVLQLLVFRRLFRGLYEEATRTEEILALIPSNVIDTTPALREFFKSETDGIASVSSATANKAEASKRLSSQ